MSPRDKSPMANGHGSAKSSSTSTVSSHSSPAQPSPLQSPSRRAAHVSHLQPFGLPATSFVLNREKQPDDLFVDSTRLATLIRRLDSEKATNYQDDGAENFQEDVWLDLYKILFTIRAAFRNASSVAGGDETTQHWSRHTHLFARLAKIKLLEDTQRQCTSATSSPLAYHAQKSIPATVRDMAGSLAYLCSQDDAARAQLYQHVH